MKEAQLPLVFLTSYKTGIWTLCSKKYFVPEGWKLALKRETPACVVRALPEAHTYERLGIRPEVTQKNGQPYE